MIEYTGPEEKSIKAFSTVPEVFYRDIILYYDRKRSVEDLIRFLVGQFGKPSETFEELITKLAL